MSEELRRQLAQRLDVKRRAPGDPPALQLYSTMQKSKSSALMPIFAIQSNKSSSSLSKPRKLNPISPFIKTSPSALVLPKLSELEEPSLSKTIQKNKLLPPLSNPKQKKKHYHGDGMLIEEKEKEEQHKPYEFIQVIKNDPELMEDFWYCNRIGDAYDFQLVPFSKKNEEYLTISSRGITHFTPGGAYFLSLEEWEREYKLYQKLKEISFFKQYKKWKNFSLWKNVRRKKMMDERAKFLEAELFILDDKLRDPLLDLREKSWELLRFDLFDISFDKVRTIDQFNLEQDRKRTEGAKELEALEIQIKKDVENSCRNSLEAFKRENKSTANNDDPNKGPEEDAEPFLVGDMSNKQMPYTQGAIIRTHHKRLAKFVRLCDYQIIDAKVMLSFQSNKKIRNAITFDYNARDKKASLRRQNQPLFVVKCFFEGMNLSFEPTNEHIKKAIYDATIRGLTILLNNYMLVSAPEFEKYSKALEEYEEKQTEEDFDLLQMIVNDEQIKLIQADVKAGIDSSFAKLVEYANRILPFIEIYHANDRLNLEALRDDTEFIKETINNYKKQEEDFKAIKEIEDIGIFQLNIEYLKSVILPSPTICLKRIEAFLPQIALESATALTLVLNEANKNLKGNPRKVEEYVMISKHIKDIEEKLHEITNRVNDLKDLMQLLEVFSIRFEDNVKRKYHETLTALDALRQRMQSFYERAETDKIKFTRELRDKIVNVDKRTVELKEILKNEKIASKESSTQEMLELLSSIGEEVSVLIVDTKAFNNYQIEMEIEPKNFIEVYELQKDFQRKYDMWKALHEWQHKVLSWNETAFSVIDVDKISKEVDMYHRVAKKSKVLEEQGNYVPQVLKAKVETLKDTMPVVVDLRCKSLKERHWKDIRKEFKLEIDINDPKFTLKNLLELKVNNIKDKIAEIALRARKEEEIERKLDEVVSSWDEVEFNFKHVKPEDYYIFTDIDDIVTHLEETQVTLTTLLTNRFLGPLFDKVDLWSKKFKLFASTFEEWLLCQKQWGELDKIFKSGDIAKKLKDKYKKFIQIDTQFKEKMRPMATTSSRALVACTKDGLLKTLQEWNKSLEKLQKTLEDYLDKQRTQFARFFFLSNDELLLILSNSQNGRLVQPHLKNMFEGIYELDFDEEKNDSILAIVSAEKEKVEIAKGTKAKGNIEDWLKNLENAMFAALKHKMSDANSSCSDMTRKEIVYLYPSQIVLTIGMIMWVSATEDALSNKDVVLESLGDLCEQTSNYLDELSQLVRENLDLQIRRKVVALVTQDVHNRDTLEWLKDEEVVSVNDFKWQQQLRYYWNTSSDNCVIKQINATFPYGYEFLGATTRLVITALTDRCWMTITGALKINLGASPAGPAGTGKTESTKDLAKAMGRYCVVFNCSEQITYMMMEKLFMGLCYTGSWSCLDEFNRIDIEVLSVIAQQLRIIKHAKDEEKPEFFFEDKKTLLNPTMGVFITMNPNYVGRTELPDNLKVMFRPISMMVPDYTLIAEVMLYAEGFQMAKDLSQKMTKLYKLASEQLSQQDHYDFGMRAVKSVLNMAGALKRKEPHLTEEVILIRAMKDSNIPKFLKEDLVLFNAIVVDLFPHAVIKDPDYGEIESCLRECIEKEQLKATDGFVSKVIQLYETLEVRFGTMIVGPATAGKSSCYKILAKTMTELRNNKSKNSSFQKVIYQVLNPKAISMGELYGEYNETTQDWKDGLGSSIIREFARRDEPTRRWVVFDGPVDSLWIENMNTVLDDNMMLCLANQERIKLKPEMRMIFEVGDLTSASPATVSRCGMLYMNIQAVGWRPILDTHLGKLLAEWNPKFVDHLHLLINTYFAKCLQILRKGLFEPIATNNNSVVMSFCNLLKAVTLPEVCPRMNDSAEHFKKYIEKVFVFCLAWGLGGALDAKSKNRFDQLISSELGVDLPKGSVFESFVSPYKIGGEYKLFESVKPEFVYKPSMSYFQLLVPTVDTVRFQQLLKYLISIQKPIFITGNSGVGKSVIIYNSLMSFKETSRISPIFITFSAQTSSQQTQNSIVSKLNPIKKDLLGGHGSNEIALMIDDVNMPTVERYGAQPPIELLRHFCDHGTIYDRDKKFAMKVIDTTLICCAAPPTGGRSALTQRFTRHFQMVTIPDTSEDSMTLIFRTILDCFYQNGFKQEIQNMASSVVSATISIYLTLKSQLLPTPSKSHYLFNLRDVSKVFQGMLMTRAALVLNQDVVMRMWIHEVLRVFHDRLTNDHDKKWLERLLIKDGTQFFKTADIKEEMFEEPHILFVDFLKGDQDMEDRDYVEVKDHSLLGKRINEFLEDYNVQNAKQMELVLFNDAVDHLARICRILRQQRGNCMLIGVGGCGKQSLSRLASFICHCEFFQIQVTKDYKLHAFREDLKKLFLSSGGPSPKTSLFLITDTQIINESFLEDINNILNSGEVPNLFTKEEMDNIEADLRPIAEKEKVMDNFFNFFIQRVRMNLHIILCMSPIGDSLRVRMRMFPSLVNCCTIDWVSPWPTDALLSVGKSKLLELPLDGQPRPEAQKNRELLSQMCVYVHESVLEVSEEFSQVLNRKVYITPKSYLDMISCYYKLLQEKHDELNSSRTKYKLGVEQLVKTNKEVAQMQKILIELAPELERKKKESEELARTVEIDSVKANKVKGIVEEEEREVNTKAQEIKVLQEDAENDLREAMPILEGAVKALQNIDRKQIMEIRTFAAPPELVLYTLEAIAILMEAPTNIDSIKKLLQNQFLESLMNFPRDSIKPVTLRKLRNKIAANPNFTPDKVEVQNFASKSLCQWVFAIENYAKISKDVEPKKKRLEELNKALSEAMANLKATQERLSIELKKVDQLESQLRSVIDEQNRLDNEIQTTNVRLSRASVLTEGLKEEHKRWEIALEKLSEQIKDILGNTFIASASVSYYGPFTGTYRNKLVSMWMNKCSELGIPISPSFDLQEVLGDPIQIREWNIFTLPNDSISVNNAIIISRSERWPLLIDPQEQANRWIKKMEEDKGLKIVKQTDKDFGRSLEYCLKDGYPMLIEDAGESLNPLLEPVVSKNLVEQSPGRYTLRIGETDIDYDNKFKLYITTKLPNPHYLPEVSIKVSLINFTVTMQGLEEQLLGEVVKREEPKIEAEQNRLIKEISDSQRDLKQIEQSILNSLSATEGNILDDAKLIAKLDSSKKYSDSINKRMVTSEKTKQENELAREKYKSVARRGSIMYFVIADLSTIDPMYQYSLNYFLKLFALILSVAPRGSSLKERIENLVKSVTEIIYSNICRGLFNAHKIIFSFLVSSQILRDIGEISDIEWSFLLKGPALSLSSFKKIKNPNPQKLNEKTWKSLVYIQNTCKVFQEPPICEELTKNLEAWEGYFTCKEPHLQEIPAPFNSISKFNRLLMIKAFREEKLIYAITNFVIDVLGEKFVKIPPVSMEELFQETTKRTPVIFILSPGADPMSMIQRLAVEKKFSEKIDAISLGKGQEEKAKKTIERGMREGKWVILQNCHLAKSWMPDLDKQIEGFDDPKNNIHEDFRIFLTSMPCTYFPIPILQNGVKLTIEPAKGIQSNLQRSLNMLSEDRLNATNKPETWKKVLFSLCMFHAVVQERRKFGPLGWNLKYEFNDSDLDTSMKILENFINEQDQVPWEAIKFVVGEINYGGRVTDELDRRCLNSILQSFLKPEVLQGKHRYMDSPVYFIPDELTLESLKNYAKSLPLADDPDIFGMHDNANITFQRNESNFIINIALSIQPKEKGINALGKTSDEIVDELASKYLDELPMVLMKSEEKVPIFTEDSNGLMDAMATFLSQEMERFNKLLIKIKTSLEDLRNAITGLVLMSDDLDRMYTSISENRVPAIWAKVSYPSLKPLSSWFADLRERIKFLREWLSVGKPKAYCLSAFFFPQGFLTAVLQTFSREYTIPIDTLSFFYEFQTTSLISEIYEKINDGVMVYGLYMEGCRWDFDVPVLEDSIPGEMYSVAPLILFSPSEKNSSEPDDYLMPLYKTSERAGTLSTTGHSTNYIISIDCPTNKKPSHWVLRGAAFLCQLND